MISRCLVPSSTSWAPLDLFSNGFVLQVLSSCLILHIGSVVFGSTCSVFADSRRAEAAVDLVWVQREPADTVTDLFVSITVWPASTPSFHLSLSAGLSFFLPAQTDNSPSGCLNPHWDEESALQQRTGSEQDPIKWIQTDSQASCVQDVDWTQPLNGTAPPWWRQSRWVWVQLMKNVFFLLKEQKRPVWWIIDAQTLQEEEI